MSITRESLIPDGDCLWTKNISPVNFPRMLNQLFEFYDQAQRFWILDSGGQAGCVVVKVGENVIIFFDVAYPIHLYRSNNSISLEDSKYFDWDVDNATLSGNVTIRLTGKEDLFEMQQIILALNCRNMGIGWGGQRETATLVFLILSGIVKPFEENRNEIVLLNLEPAALELVRRSN